GVPTAVHYPVPLHRQPAYRDLCRISGTLDHSTQASGRVFSLPMHPCLDSDTQQRIVRTILDSIGG
ncbi:MAG: DegT/DnrJ/EryC1/StrS family aminotransferase, partial [Methylococcales bacterium]